MSNFYGSAPTSHNTSQRYASSGDHARHASTFQTEVRSAEDGRQHQYASGSYGWVHQNPRLPSTSTQNTYASDAWQSRPDAYNYPRGYYGSSEHANINSQAYQSRDTYNSQNTQGLNHLAYASGLEPAAPMDNTIRPSQPQPTTYEPSATSSASQTRPASSVNVNSRYATHISQQPPSAPHITPNDNYSPSVNNQNLALDAATALASAARSYKPRSNQQGSGTGTIHTPKSPAKAITQPAPRPTSQRTTPSYSVAPPDVEHHRKSSEQTRPANASANDSSYVAVVSSAERNKATEQRSKPVISKRTTGNQQSSSLQTARQQPINSNPQSIANLVSGPSGSGQHLKDTTGDNENMPHYVDPTQVFNPFHKEYERKKREAAEAEARKKAEEQRRLEEQRRRTIIEAAKENSEEMTVTKSKSEAIRQGHMTNPSKDNHSTNEISRKIGSSASNEDNMATEMQKMMAKMKDFRNSNPALFQKLWNDMRGSGPSAVPPNSTVPQSPSPQNTQKDLPSEAERSVKSVKSRHQKPDNSQIPTSVPMNGFKVTVEDNPEGLPDLGRFPAERRRRHPYAKHKIDLATDVQKAREQISSNDAAAQILPTTTPARIAESGTAWPEPRRRAVAVAAIQLLKSDPVNESIQITAQEICSLLERNPSYLDLCTALESRGLHFQRTVFARELLKNVPELQTPVPRASTPARQDITSISTVAHAQLPTSPVAPSQPLMVTQHVLQPPLYPPNLAHSDPDFSQQPQMLTDQNVKSEKKTITKQSGKTSKAQTSRPPEPPVGSKEAAARKRDFSELIDLTELDDNDNYVLPTKQQRVEPEPQIDPFKQLNTSVRVDMDRNSSAPLRFNPNTQPPVPAPTANVQNYPQISRASPSQIDTIQSRPAILPDGRSRMILAKKLDRSEALQKSYYDPKTVARDVLIASGRHHSERPLNLHLANLIGVFMDVDSDVSTFDWDAVDPGGPPLPRVEYVDIPAAPPKFKLGDRVRKRVRLTEIEKTREPEEGKRDMRPTSQTPALPSSHGRSSVAPSPQLASFPKRDNLNLFSTLAHRLHQKSLDKLAANNTEKAVTPSARKISIDIPVSSSSHALTRPASNRAAENKANMETQETPHKRRGRPPGSKNKNTAFAAMKQQAKAILTEMPLEQAPEPVQHSYKCKWVKCHAELHNVDTLKRHISKKHISDKSEIEEGQYVCWWKKCRYLEPDGRGNMAPKETFSSHEDLERHVHEDHIQPILLKYGDGPKTMNIDPQSVETARQRFLADANGRSTTPLVSPDGNADYPLDPMVLTRVYPNGPKTDKEKAEVAAQNAFMKAHGNKHKDGRSAAEEVVRAMEARKQRTGPGIDRGGCTLINEARRSTFIQAPGISGIVPLEY